MIKILQHFIISYYIIWCIISHITDDICNITITNWNLHSSSLLWFLNPGISIPPLIINYLTHLISWILSFLQCPFLPLFFQYNYTFIFLLLHPSLILLVHHTFFFVLSIQFHKICISGKSIYLHIYKILTIWNKQIQDFSSFLRILIWGSIIPQFNNFLVNHLNPEIFK